MPAFVTLVQGKAHLRVTTSAEDTDITLKIDQASGIVADYLKGRADATWDTLTVPVPVQSATLLVLGHLYVNRGDDMAADQTLWQALERLLWRFRDPALA